jgi:TolC family type I secretion outer membrane protein
MACTATPALKGDRRRRRTLFRRQMLTSAFFILTPAFAIGAGVQVLLTTSAFAKPMSLPSAPARTPQPKALAPLPKPELTPEAAPPAKLEAAPLALAPQPVSQTAPPKPPEPVLRLRQRDDGPAATAPLTPTLQAVAPETAPPQVAAPQLATPKSPESTATDRLMQLLTPSPVTATAGPPPSPTAFGPIALPSLTLEPAPAGPVNQMVAKAEQIRFGPGDETPIATVAPPPSPQGPPQAAAPAEPIAAAPVAPKPATGNWPGMALRLRTNNMEQAGFAPAPPPIRVASLLAPEQSDVAGKSSGGKLILEQPPASAAPDIPDTVFKAATFTPPPPPPPPSPDPYALTPSIGRPTAPLTAVAAPPRLPLPEPLFAPRGDEPETLSMAILSALEMNPEIQIAEAQRDDALYGVDEARAAMLPSVNLSASQGRERRTTQDESENAGNNTRTEITISARQNLFDFGASNESLRGAENGAESAEWSYRAQVDQVGLKIAQTFHVLAERQAILALAEKNVEAHEAILRTVKAQREFGMVTGADVSRIEARLNAARQELLDRKSQLDQAREEYRRLLNRAPGRVLAPTGVESLIPSDVEDAVRLLEESNPQVMQARRLMESLQRQRASQRAGGLPRVDLELEGSSRNNVGGETGRAEEARAMVALRMPLFDGGARQAAVNRLTARIRQAEFQVERAKRDAEQSLRNDYTALAAAKAKIESIEAEVAAGERLVVLYQEQFKNGSRSVFDLLDSQQTLYTAQVKREQNRTEVRLSSYRVLGTMGVLVSTVTKADNMNVRLFPAEEATSVRGGRPVSGYSQQR